MRTDRRDREDQIFAGISSGVPAETIYKSLSADRHKVGRQQGAETERTFEKHVWAYYGGEVVALRRSDFEQDRNGIDYYVTFKDGSELPVQVKSSDEAVTDFKQDDRYVTRFHKRIIVINSAPYVSKKKFKESFSSELRRIRRLDTGSFE